MGNFIKTMSIRLTVLALAAIAVANAEMMTMYTNTPTSDPAGNHCQDFTADMSTADAQQWWSADSYAYPASQGWTNGSVCDPKTYPVVEQHEHPIGVNDVTLRLVARRSLPLSLRQHQRRSASTRLATTTAPSCRSTWQRTALNASPTNGGPTTHGITTDGPRVPSALLHTPS